MNEKFLKRIRDPRYLDKIMTSDEAAAMIQPGATLGISGFDVAGDPKEMGAALVRRARAGEKLDLTLYSGASVGNHFDGELAGLGAIRRRMPYQANKTMRAEINAGRVAYHDIPMGVVPGWIRSGYMGKIDVAIVEAVAIDENGGIVPTTSVGATPAYVEMADRVIIEINTYVPESLEGVHDIYTPERAPYTKPIPLVHPADRIGTTSIPVDFSKVAAVVCSSTPDDPYGVAPVDDEFRQMASNLIGFLHQEVAAGRLCDPLPPIQAGVGSVANAVMEGLLHSDFENLYMYSEVLQNAVFKLLDAGKLAGASGSSLTIAGDIRDEFFSNFSRWKDRIVLRPQDITNSPEVIRRLGIIAVNTVIEADLYGNTNSSYVDGSRLMNGVGGSGDYCQNAGLSIFVTKSTAKNGLLSSIVPMVSHVDHTIHEIHVLITEQGVADLRGLDVTERARTIIENCAHPRFRPRLTAYLEQSAASSPWKEYPLDMEAAIHFDKVWHE